MLNSLLLAASILGVSTGFQPSVSHQLLSPDTGQLKLSVGTLSEPLAGELSAAAWAWAMGQRAALGLPANSSLRNVQTHGTRFGAAVRLQQQIDGVDVYGAQVVVTINAQRQVTMVSSSVLPFERSVMGWTINSDEALARAAKAIPMALLQNSGKPYGGVRREVFPLGVEAHAGYLTMVPTLNQTENWYVAIDATTGEVLWKQNRVFHASGDARAYASSPGGLDSGVGAQPTIDVSLTHADGGSMVLADAGGYLTGDQLIAFNCCPNKDCSTLPDAGPKRVTGQMVLMGFNVTYDVPLCDRLQRANNDVSIHDAGSYVYPPIDPPIVTAGVVGPVIQSDLSHSDEFAEVHAFFHVNQVYDWVRLLSSTAAPLFPTNVPAITGFKMRDELRVPARMPAILTNVVFPDIGEITSNPAGKCNLTSQPIKCTIDKLARQDNAAFMPKENFAQIPLPELAMDVDTLMIFQGNYSDFAYDAPVLWHEFGHGVVYATAALGFDQLAVDTRSANNETGAMHEGFADFLAGAFGNLADIGTYVGPRIGGTQSLTGVRKDSFLRSLNNTFTCPDVLWGEVHQDSQHLSAALWLARNSFFLGTDNGRTFDAAFYASLVSMSPQVNFTDAAAIIVAHVKGAFPGIADADTKMQTVFTQKGVVSCSKILDVTGATTGRPYYGITAGGPAGFPATTVIPGPYQMKVKTPAGMKSITLTAAGGGGGGPLGGAPKPKFLVKVGQPITFAKVGAQLTHNADLFIDATISGSNVTATATLPAPCGAASEVYFTLGSTQAETLQNVKVSFLPADSCTVTDGGAGGGTGGGTGGSGAGGGTGAGDGGSEVKQVPWIGGKETGAGAPKGCGCSGVEAGLGGFAALLLMMRRRRKS